MKSHVIAVIAGVGLLAGCNKSEERAPEKTCSAQATYDQLTALLASQIGQAASGVENNPLYVASASSKALSRVVSFVLPTLEDVNRDTKKIKCEAMMQVAVPTGMQNALSTGGLQINEVASDHVQVRVSYSIQPSADSGEQVVTLEQASDLAVLAIQASMLATKRLQEATGTAPAPEGVATTNGIDPVDDEQDNPTYDGSAPNLAPAQAPTPQIDPDEAAADRVTDEVNERRAQDSVDNF